MYSIRVRLNKRCVQLKHGDIGSVGVRLKSGRIRWCNWRGFTLDVVQPCKLVVEQYTLESAWDPRRANLKMPEWQILEEGEFLLGSWSGGFVYTALPFRIIN